MYNNDFLIYFICSFCIGSFILLLSFFLGGISSSRYKNIPFESGISSLGGARFHTPVKFYIIAVFFVIFDIESFFLYSWAVSVKECGWLGFIKFLCFSITLFIVILYLINMNILNFVSNNIKK